MKLFWFLGSAEAASRLARPLDQQLSGSRKILWLIVLALVAFIGWAYVAEIDQITRAPGTIITSSRSQVIQSQEGGTIAEMMVREGEIVERGQVLVRLDRTRAETGYQETRARTAGLTATIARLQAEMSGGEPRFPTLINEFPEFRENQRTLLKRRRAAINEELASLQWMLNLAKRELEMHQPLLQQGDVSQADVLRLERQVADVRAQMTNRRNRYYQEAQTDLSKAQEELAGIEQMLEQRKGVLDQTELTAPVRGVVKNVRITTRGGVIRPGEEVMQIVPLEDDLVIEARVTPAEIAFLKFGLEARVKIDAYDYTIYGDLPGKLIYISADTLTEDLRQGEHPYYRIQVRTVGRRFSGRPNEDLMIQTGMTATVEIKTGRNTVLSYLSKPVIKTVSQAMGER